VAEPGEPERPDPRHEPRQGRGEPIVEFGPPISDVPWSPEFSLQSLEVLIVTLEGDTPLWLKPVHADSLRVGLSASAKPGDVVLETLGWYDLVPRVVHSTSWRHQEGQVVLTYVAVVDPPPSIPTGALRHLAWLFRDDAMIAEALPTWKDVLDRYLPEPSARSGDPPGPASDLHDHRQDHRLPLCDLVEVPGEDTANVLLERRRVGHVRL
jgi:hypothetical protein